MSNRRDNFSAATKELLAKRVRYRCSNPNCRKTTIGPSSEGDKIINIGVAAHIKAAAFGGKRFDIRMTKEERCGINNGIWLCQSCSKLIDSDAKKYTVELLHSWKRDAEHQTAMEVECQLAVGQFCNDIDRLKFYLQCLDRPAFQDQRDEGTLLLDEDEQGEYQSRISAFMKAINATIIALNTGVLRDNDGIQILKSEGKSLVESPVWRERLFLMTDILVKMRRSLENRNADIMRGFVEIEYARELENSRIEVVRIMNSICRDAGLPELRVE